MVTEGQAVTGKNFQLDPGATISGTVYQSDGATPLTGKNIWIYAYTGSPCSSLTWVEYAYVDSATGTYTIPGLPAGTYYLQTFSSDNYISEWWASPQGVRDCAGAQSIVVTEGQAVTGKNFQLDPTTIPVIKVTPISLNFGYVPVGSTKDLTLTVKNAGVGTLTGNATTAAPFSVVSGGSYTLGPDQSQVVTIRYQPTSAGLHTGEVLFTGWGGATVPVTGKTEGPRGLPWLILLLGN